MLANGSSCSVAEHRNVSSGTICGARKFVVSYEDCCDYCIADANCRTAVFASYYCTPYSFVSATEASSTALMLSAATLPPTPPPTHSHPTDWIVLTECAVSTQCSRAEDYSCQSQVTPANRCAFDPKSSRYVLAESSENGFRRSEFLNETCGGPPSSQTFFPLVCSWSSNDHVNRWGHSFPWVNQSGQFSVVAYECNNALCQSSCSTAFEFSSGTCTRWDRGGSSSSVASFSGSFYPQTDHVLAVCFNGTSSIATFSFSSSAQCEADEPVVGYALPTNVCYFDEMDNHFENLCNPSD